MARRTGQRARSSTRLSGDHAVVSSLLKAANVRDEDLAIVHQLDDAFRFQARDLPAYGLDGKAEAIRDFGS